MKTATPPSPFYELHDGETVSGAVVRLPQPGMAEGNRVLVRTAAGVVGVPATAKKGATVLERLLTERRVRPGDHVAITYFGRRRTADGEREYRHFGLRVLP